MKQSVARTILTLTVAFAPTASIAQLPTSDVTRLKPRAARAGKTVQVTVYGENLEELTDLRFTHPGISAEPVMLPPDEFFPEPRMDGNKFDVTVISDVPPGIYEARAVGYFGYSKARPFVVAPADSRETIETGKNISMDTAMPVEVNSIVTGEVASRRVDWFRFHGKAGQRILIELFAERIDSRLDGQLVVYTTDGREIARNRDTFGRDSFLEIQPAEDGEFLVALADILYRGSAEYFYRLRIHDQPHIDFVWPPAIVPGTTQKLKLYGRNLPDSTLDESAVVNGHALETLEVDVTAPDESAAPAGYFSGTPRQGILPGFDYQFGDSNVVRVGFATAPVVAETNELSARPITVPSEIAGRFDDPNDEDAYRFTAKATEVYCIEAIADRMGSRIDPYLVIHRIDASEDGSETLTQVAENDDMPSFFASDGKSSVNADTNDAFVKFTPEQDGEYQVKILDQFGNGGMASLYRLAIRHATPDFQLIATTERPLPSNRTGYSVAPLLRQGARWAIRILCPRQDGFEGEIIITAEGLPKGVTCEPLVLSGIIDQGMLVVSAAENAAAWAGDIRIVGRAVAESPDGPEELVREARFSSLVWGHIFADSIRVRSRLTERVPLSVNDKEKAPVLLNLAEQQDWTVEVGQKLELPVKVENVGQRVGNLTVEPYGLWGIVRNPPTVNIGEEDSDGTLSIDFRKTGNFAVEPGRYMFCLQGTGVVRYRHNYPANMRTGADRRRIRKLVTEISAIATAAAADAVAAQENLDGVKRRLDDAEEDKEDELMKLLEAATAALHAAKEADGKAKSRLKEVELAQAAIDKVAKDAGAKAVEKNTKFAAWSRLITVNVVEPSGKK